MVSPIDLVFNNCETPCKFVKSCEVPGTWRCCLARVTTASAGDREYQVGITLL